MRLASDTDTCSVCWQSGERRAGPSAGRVADGAREARDARMRARARQPCGSSPVVEGANAGTGKPAAGRRRHRPAAELRAAELCMYEYAQN